MATTREVFLAPQYSREACPTVERVRSTLISASIQGVREMGWEKRYLAALPRARQEEMLTLVAGVWVPLELGFVHYTACEQMGLSSDEIKAVGRSVSLRTQKTFLGTVGIVAAGAGATPWSLYQHAHRIWGRIFDGGDHVGYKVGPKDLEVTCTGCPLLRIKYFRTALGAYYAAIGGLLAQTVHWRELPAPASDTTITLRVSWV